MRKLLDGHKANDAFYAKRSLAGARASWVGPTSAATDLEAAMIMPEIQRAFVSRNSIREIVNRHRDGVIGREAGLVYSPPRGR